MRIVTLALAEYMAYKSGMFSQDDGSMIALILHALVLPFILLMPHIFIIFISIISISFINEEVSDILMYLIIHLSFIVIFLRLLLVFNKVFKVKTKTAIRAGEYTG